MTAELHNRPEAFGGNNMSRPWDEFYKLVHFGTYASKQEILVLMNNDYLSSQEPPACVHVQASVAIAIAAYERKAQLQSWWDVGLNVLGLS